MKRVLVDTGPLVAILSRDDAHHELCVSELHRMPTPLLSCWPVITEAAWLLRRSPEAVRQLLSNVDGGFITLLPLTGKEGLAIAELMKRYEDRALNWRMLHWFTSQAVRGSGRFLPSTSVTSLYTGVRVNAPS
jgi:predicted nucleic acid-binding protein